MRWMTLSILAFGLGPCWSPAHAKTKLDITIHELRGTPAGEMIFTRTDRTVFGVYRAPEARLHGSFTGTISSQGGATVIEVTRVSIGAYLDGKQASCFVKDHIQVSIEGGRVRSVIKLTDTQGGSHTLETMSEPLTPEKSQDAFGDPGLAVVQPRPGPARALAAEGVRIVRFEARSTSQREFSSTEVVVFPADEVEWRIVTDPPGKEDQVEVRLSPQVHRGNGSFRVGRENPGSLLAAVVRDGPSRPDRIISLVTPLADLVMSVAGAAPPRTLGIQRLNTGVPQRTGAGELVAVKGEKVVFSVSPASATVDVRIAGNDVVELDVSDGATWDTAGERFVPGAYTVSARLAGGVSGRKELGVVRIVDPAITFRAGSRSLTVTRTRPQRGTLFVPLSEFLEGELVREDASGPLVPVLAVDLGIPEVKELRLPRAGRIPMKFFPGPIASRLADRTVQLRGDLGSGHPPLTITVRTSKLGVRFDRKEVVLFPGEATLTDASGRLPNRHLVLIVEPSGVAREKIALTAAAPVTATLGEKVEREIDGARVAAYDVRLRVDPGAPAGSRSSVEARIEGISSGEEAPAERAEVQIDELRVSILEAPRVYFAGANRLERPGSTGSETPDFWINFSVEAPRSDRPRSFRFKKVTVRLRGTSLDFERPVTDFSQAGGRLQCYPEDPGLFTLRVPASEFAGVRAPTAQIDERWHHLRLKLTLEVEGGFAEAAPGEGPCPNLAFGGERTISRTSSEFGFDALWVADLPVVVFDFPAPGGGKIPYQHTTRPTVRLSGTSDGRTVDADKARMALIHGLRGETPGSRRWRDWIDDYETIGRFVESYHAGESEHFLSASLVMRDEDDTDADHFDDGYASVRVLVSGATYLGYFGVWDPRIPSPKRTDPNRAGGRSRSSQTFKLQILDDVEFQYKNSTKHEGGLSAGRKQAYNAILESGMFLVETLVPYGVGLRVLVGSIVGGLAALDWARTMGFLRAHEGEKMAEDPQNEGRAEVRFFVYVYDGADPLGGSAPLESRRVSFPAEGATHDRSSLHRETVRPEARGFDDKRLADGRVYVAGVTRNLSIVAYTHDFYPYANLDEPTVEVTIKCDIKGEDRTKIRITEN